MLRGDVLQLRQGEQCSLYDHGSMRALIKSCPVWLIKHELFEQVAQVHETSTAKDWVHMGCDPKLVRLRLALARHLSHLVKAGQGAVYVKVGSD